MNPPAPNPVLNRHTQITFPKSMFTMKTSTDLETKNSFIFSICLKYTPDPKQKLSEEKQGREAHDN